MNNQILLEMKNITMTFPGVKALSNTQLTVNKGEIHALMGENGAGKSTLMKVLMGINKPDSGEIFFNGQKLEANTPKEALDAGISMIHQELSPVYEMTVADNIFLGREFVKIGLVDVKDQNKKTDALLEEYEMQKYVRADMKMKELSVAHIQMIEIIKAISYNSKLIIMDEPTSALSGEEVKTLFRTIKLLKQKGVSIIYISHRIEEIFEICDKVTILRDGEYIGMEDLKNITSQKLINMMVGRELSAIYPKYEVKQGDIELEVKNLTRKGYFEDISFHVRKGEILGVAGLVGAGRSEIVRAIFGFDAYDSGEIYLEGKKLKINHPADAIEKGISLVSEDRKALGLVLCRPIRENITLPSLKEYVKGLIINHKLETEKEMKIANSLNLKMSGLDQLTNNLSGGNQQKVVLAKWLLRNPKVLILDEPTRGIDVGAKSEIHKMICDLASEGIAIIMISSEMPEIMGMSDRIIVIGEGRLCGEFSIKEASQEELLKCALGGN
jgi:ABC-type sugar transport system, ATPase component